MYVSEIQGRGCNYSERYKFGSRDVNKELLFEAIRLGEFIKLIRIGRG